jgi:hypothetical protein
VIAVFGPRSAGKTVFLSVLHCAPSAGVNLGYDISATGPNRDRTLRDLQFHYRKLCAREWPHATPFDAATVERNTYEFEVSLPSGRKYETVIADVGGELTRPSDAAELDHARLRGNLLSKYTHVDGIFLFVRSDLAKADGSWEYKQQVDVLLTLLRRNRRSDTPVAIILSKWDVQTTFLGPKPATEQDQVDAERFFCANYPMLQKRMSDVCQRYEIFPVSSTGSVENGRPPRTLSPFNVGSPFTWILEASDEVHLRRTLRAVTVGLAGIFLLCASVFGWGLSRHIERLHAAKQAMTPESSATLKALAEVGEALRKENYGLGVMDPWWHNTDTTYRTVLSHAITREGQQLVFLTRRGLEDLVGLINLYQQHFGILEPDEILRLQSRAKDKLHEVVAAFEVADDEAYAKVTGAVETSSVAEACRIYLETRVDGYPFTRHRDDVQRWINWYNARLRGDAVGVTIAWIQIARDSVLAATIGDSGTAAVTLSVNGESARVESIEFTEDERITEDEVIGTFHPRLKGTNIQITLATENWIGRSATVERLGMLSLNDEISLDKGRARIQLLCSAVVAPPLPR